MATIPKSVREAEAKALKAIYERQSPKPNQAAFAALNGLGTASMVYQYTTDRRPLNLDIATKFARGLGVAIDAFSPRLAALATATGQRTGACPGYVRDHIVPLCAGGADHPANMQWQTVAEGKAKDREEVRTCRSRPKS